MTTKQVFAEFTVGQEIGFSDWLTVEQELLNQFGDCTLDPDPMHVDPDWSRDNSAFGHTVAFGFWTMSMLTHLLHSALDLGINRETFRKGYYLNYGFDRLRLVAPVPTGSRIRGRFRVLEVRQDESDRIIVVFGSEIQVEGGLRPALVAEWLAVWVPGACS